MQNRWMGRILRVATALALSPALFAQTSPRPAAQSGADLSGMWIIPRGDRLTSRFREEDAPLQAWALEMYKANRQGVRNLSGSGVNQRDPEHFCLPNGVPRVYTTPSPIEIVQVPGRVYMIFSSLQNPLPRYIYTDGSGHPEGYPTTLMGHAIGRWDGDTLVVDTIGIDEVNWLDGAGTPHSDALHVVERLRRVAQDTLEIDFRFEDPKAFTRSWTGKKVFQLEPDWQSIPGIACEDFFKEAFAAGRYRHWEPIVEKPNEAGR
jgi:hypothetical protein